jgi:hypothetical protein
MNLHLEQNISDLSACSRGAAKPIHEPSTWIHTIALLARSTEAVNYVQAPKAGVLFGHLRHE